VPTLKTIPEDFVVEEVPAYEPSGTGEHVFVRFTKTDRTTLDAVRVIARTLGCDPREAGFAGMKDKRAVTTQTLSLHTPRGETAASLADRARALTLDGIVVLAATPHGNKLKPGHLAGNRFTIAVRGIAAGERDTLDSKLIALGRDGMPNAFGAQRFGAGGDNAERALAWLRGEERGPRDPRVQRLLWSSLQSAVFNAVLDERVREGTWNTPLEGDLLKVRDTGGLFVCSDVQIDRERAVTGEVSPTGPVVGARMRAPEGAPAALERRITERILGEGMSLERTRSLGEGTRRALRVWVRDLRWRFDEGDEPVGNATVCLRVEFMLPKGAYATTALASVVDIEQARSEPSDGGLENEPADV
jgi:tRNA pseudouridine13 synthase